MPSTVSNTSPLIWLAKIGKLNLLKDLFHVVLVSEEVGLQEGYSDALVIKDAFDQGWIKVERLDEKQIAICQKIMRHSFELHEGEVKAIVLAREIGKDMLLLMDDSSGRAFAESWGLKVKGVLFVIIAAIRNDLLDNDEAKEGVLNLVSKGFRIEPKFLAKIIHEIEKENMQ